MRSKILGDLEWEIEGNRKGDEYITESVERNLKREGSFPIKVFFEESRRPREMQRHMVLSLITLCEMAAKEERKAKGNQSVGALFVLWR